MLSLIPCPLLTGGEPQSRVVPTKDIHEGRWVARGAGPCQSLEAEQGNQTTKYHVIK